MKILCKNATALSRIFLCLLRHSKRKQLNIGTWNRTSLMTLTLVLMSLFSFQVANAQGAGTGGPGYDQLKCNKCVDASDIAKSAVTNDKIKKQAVSASKLASRAVTTSKLDSGAVTQSKLASGAVSNSKIRDGAVTVDKVSPELSNAIGTSCPAGESVVGMDAGGNFVCESKLVQVLDTDLTGKIYCVITQGIILHAEAGDSAQVYLNPIRHRVDFTSATQLTVTNTYSPVTSVDFPSYTMSDEDESEVTEGTYNIVGNQLAVTLEEDEGSYTTFLTLTPDGHVFIGSRTERESDEGFEGFGTYIHIGVQADSCY